MKRIILIASLIISTYAISQPYKHAIGGKLGYGLTGSYKLFIAEKSAFDIFAGFAWYTSGFNFGANYNYHIPLSKDAKSLFLHVGGGAILSTYSNVLYSGAVFGISGNLGIEYGFKDVPLTIGAEYMPVVALNGYTGYIPGYGSLVVRYVLGK